MISWSLQKEERKLISETWRLISMMQITLPWQLQAQRMILQRKKVSKSRITREKTEGDADYPPLVSTGTEDDSPKKKSK